MRHMFTSVHYYFEQSLVSNTLDQGCVTLPSVLPVDRTLLHSARECCHSERDLAGTWFCSPVASDEAVDWSRSRAAVCSGVSRDSGWTWADPVWMSSASLVASLLMMAACTGGSGAPTPATSADSSLDILRVAMAAGLRQYNAAVVWMLYHGWHCSRWVVLGSHRSWAIWNSESTSRTIGVARAGICKRACQLDFNLDCISSKALPCNQVWQV